MVDAVTPSFASARKLFRSSTWNRPQAAKSKAIAVSNSAAAALAPSSCVSGAATAIGMGRKFAPEISITGRCANATVGTNTSNARRESMHDLIMEFSSFTE